MQTTPVAATVKNQFNLHVINCPSVWFCYSGVKTLSIDRLRRTPSLSRGLSPTVNEFHHHLLSILKPKLIFTEHSVHVLLKSLLPSRVHVCLQRVFNMQESVYKSQSSTVIDNRQQRGRRYASPSVTSATQRGWWKYWEPRGTISTHALICDLSMCDFFNEKKSHCYLVVFAKVPFRKRKTHTHSHTHYIE